MTKDGVDGVLKCVSRIQCVAVRIYNLIREVGYGKISADNALHQMVEDYKNLKDIANDMSGLVDYIESVKRKAV